MSDSADEPKKREHPEGEIIPPSKADSTGVAGNIYADIAAQITNYTDRPDLLLEVIEKHDPGFIKEMNDEARQFSRKYRNSRFRFGRAQSYSSLAVSIIVALAILFVIYELAKAGNLSGWQLVGFAIFYAVTQSGPSGFIKIAGQIAEIFRGFGGKSEK